jgi:hypothetical protein
MHIRCRGPYDENQHIATFSSHRSKLDSLVFLLVAYTGLRKLLKQHSLIRLLIYSIIYWQVTVIDKYIPTAASVAMARLIYSFF